MVNKLLATAVGSALLGAGATATLTPSVDTTKIQAEKHALIKDNIWKDVRLGEAPEWDISVVSSKEMTSAYAELATEMNAKQSPDLYTNLSRKAEERGLKCK